MSRNRKSNRDRNQGPEKFLCRYKIGIEEDSKFRVVGRLIGPGGEVMKQIAQESGAKLRVRGRGSNFLEGPERKESADPLMLCISAQDQCGFDCAVARVTELLEAVHEEYRAFCLKTGQPAPALSICQDAQPKR